VQPNVLIPDAALWSQGESQDFQGIIGYFTGHCTLHHKSGDISLDERMVNLVK
jgi:hypothetical protein